MQLKNITHLLFDLGGVIINIDPSRTLSGLSGGGTRVISFSDMAHPVHLQYEKGLISSQEFLAQVAELCALSPDEVEIHWHSLLLDIPSERVLLLQRLRQNFPLFLLSNTNALHIPEVEQILLRDTGIERLADVFDKLYLSYEMGKRKPDAEYFQQVLEENQLNPSQCLFIDDSIANIEGAKALGIQTLWIDSPHRLMDFFYEHKK
ncbi:HAD family phosphatase [Cytophagales bacterium LB-30]|uniref:HAD family phosphatase n=1 Tax=Shiella aurantiaca TaxID=3058365 RepID=A0ABT8F4P6_9BACT|nr:HAD family phosphatase [Shiella aurantiaca]MDN4165219.1 HAD family phosphatase [Shiella aurantiaca]